MKRKKAPKRKPRRARKRVTAEDLAFLLVRQELARLEEINANLRRQGFGR